MVEALQQEINYLKKFYTENVVNEYKKLLTNKYR